MLLIIVKGQVMFEAMSHVKQRKTDRLVSVWRKLMLKVWREGSRNLMPKKKAQTPHACSETYMHQLPPNPPTPRQSSVLKICLYCEAKAETMQKEDKNDGSEAQPMAKQLGENLLIRMWHREPKKPENIYLIFLLFYNGKTISPILLWIS